MQSGESEWKKVTSFTNPTDFSQIKVYNSNLGTSYGSISGIISFPPFKAKGIRIVMRTFSGNVLTTRLAVLVNDPNNVICPKECDILRVRCEKEEEKPECKKAC